jgi:two-component system CheB/CheR fusion protein
MVAIGASAGGVQALQALFSAMADNTGAAFVVIVHLDPERRSELPSILASRTRMPVV